MVAPIVSPQMALPIAHADKASFDNFWVGRNEELVTALKKISMPEQINVSDTIARKVLYLYGGSGAGKSHLAFSAIRAANRIANDETSEQGASTDTSYVSLNDGRVTTEMLSAINPSGLVCVDDINAWAGDREKESALFTLFEQVKHSDGHLLVCSSQPPGAAGFVINDLVSRLSSGLIYPVYELNDEERFFAIKLRANQRGLKIADDAVKYLLSRSSRDPGDLFEILDRIDRASLVEKRRITIPFLQNVLKR